MGGRCDPGKNRMWLAAVLLIAAVSPATALAHAHRDDAPAAISFDFRDADVRDVLRAVAEAGDVPLLVADGVAGRLTLRHSAQSWRHALEVIALAAGLDVSADADLVRVVDAAERARELDDVRRLREAHELAAPLVSRIVRLEHGDAAVMADLLSGAEARGGARRSLLSPRGFAFVEATSNSLFIADIADNVARVLAAIEAFDRLPAQVLIESEVVETSADAARAIGVQWGYRGAFGARGDAPRGSGPDLEASGVGIGEGFGIPWMGSFPAALEAGTGSAVGLAWGSVERGSEAAVLLSALERDGKARVISRPRVVTLNNVPATIKSLTVIRVKLPSTDTVVRTDGGGAMRPSVATEKIETGIVLVVTPRIAGADRVVLDLFIKSSQADFGRQVDGIPTETSREATSRVVVADGETVVLGGIYADSSDRRVAGIPFLRSIPVLGWLFRGREEATRREDLLVFITPRILATFGDLEASAGGPG